MAFGQAGLPERPGSVIDPGPAAARCDRRPVFGSSYAQVAIIRQVLCEPQLIVDWASRGGSPGRPIVDRLLPAMDDYFILKPRHSAFYETALPSLLTRLEAQRLAIVGVAGDSCVLSSALDAHIRKFPVWVPSNATASLTEESNARAMQFLAESLGCEIASIGG